MKKDLTIWILFLTCTAIILAGVLWCVEKGGREIAAIPVTVSILVEDTNNFDSYNKTLDRHKITGVQDIEGPYKKVTVHDGEITFSFEVPDNWLTETRNSGEVEMNEEELREFFGTSYGGYDGWDVDYSGYSKENLRLMMFQQLKNIYTEAKSEFDAGFPNASVSGSQYIWYTDWAGYQIDLFIVQEEFAEQLRTNQESLERADLENYEDSILRDMFRLKWFDREISGYVAKCAQSSLEVIEEGSGYKYVTSATKGRTGAIQCYLSIDEYSLIIDKQAFTGEEGDKIFEHLLNSFIVEM